MAQLVLFQIRKDKWPAGARNFWRVSPKNSCILNLKLNKSWARFLSDLKKVQESGTIPGHFWKKISQSDQGYEKLINTGTFPGHFLARVPWTLHFPGQFRDPIRSEYLICDEFLEISITFEPFDRFSKFKRLNNLEFHQDPEFRDIYWKIPNFGIYPKFRDH